MLQITLFHNFSKSVSEGNCSSLLNPVIQKLSQTASPYASIPVFIFSPRSQVFPSKNKCEHTEGTSEKGPIDSMFPL